MKSVIAWRLQPQKMAEKRRKEFYKQFKEFVEKQELMKKAEEQEEFERQTETAQVNPQKDKNFRLY